MPYFTEQYLDFVLVCLEYDDGPGLQRRSDWRQPSQPSAEEIMTDIIPGVYKTGDDEVRHYKYAPLDFEEKDDFTVLEQYSYLVCCLLSDYNCFAVFEWPHEKSDDPDKSMRRGILKKLIWLVRYIIYQREKMNPHWTIRELEKQACGIWCQSYPLV
ncbi:uncharacterized protein BDZ99DRAFT_96003 [Mytilinidion resinicola]|uniref:Uncharacterized protein n=1 Tax=Mytilinidion resinicola TaxID=574789 RepID=A0A6A6YEQ3_9PEZI|nr:uncharacterized protein BDZ99DRAFT_96003 [Mytilinidion resinicola]KAF2806484.1 hypothetical protein BDZ99DRAFT_96003 [Mytilinidion resinicola]